MLTKQFSGDLRRRAREQQKKGRSKNSRDDDFDETDFKGTTESSNTDVFYSSKDAEKGMCTF